MVGKILVARGVKEGLKAAMQQAWRTIKEVKIEDMSTQGCPLSPYLFIICAEAFWNLLTQAEKKQHIKSLRAC